MEEFVSFFAGWGYVGLFIASFVAGSLLPFSSEAVMVILIRSGLDPVGCLLAATSGNTLGGMTCYWIGRFGRPEWFTRYLRISDQQLARARRFAEGRGALMSFFTFLPYIGEALAVVMGLMRSNSWLTLFSMFAGKLVRYVVLLFTLEGIISLF